MHLKVGDFMKWLKKLFKKNRQFKIEPVPPMPSWDTIVELLYDKNLDSFCDEVINVLYSKDNSMRYVVLKDEKDIFTYQLEAIYQFDEDEWKYICSNDEALPAMWEPYLGICGISLFANEEDLMKDLKSQPEYKQYFI